MALGENMRKNDLIMLLQNIEGNPEVNIWNGAVGDLMPISRELVFASLVKYSKNAFLMHAAQEEGVKLENVPPDEINNWLKDYRKYHKFELNQYVTDEQIKEGTYRKKDVLVLSPTPTGKRTFDRFGSIEY